MISPALAHEINNLLQVAMGAMELGRAEQAKTAIRELAELIAVNTPSHGKASE